LEWTDHEKGLAACTYYLHALPAAQVAFLVGGRPLLRVHLEELRGSGLSDHTIREAGLYSETRPEEIAKLLNWEGTPAAYGPCLVFSYFDSKGQPTGYHCLKPSYPRQGESGRVVKYEVPRGRDSRLYLTAGTWPWLANTSVLLIVTEGQKKALKAAQHGFRCVGVQGVWNATWTPRDGDGNPVGPRRLAPDFKGVELKGRDVVIVFDSDASTNANVQHAEQELARLLHSKGAKVRIVRLPGRTDDDGAAVKVGLDDYLLAHGPTALHRLIGEAKPFEPRAKAPSPAVRIVRLVEDSAAELFHDHERRPFVTVPTGGGIETYSLGSEAFQDWLAGATYNLGGTVPKEAAVKDALRVLSAKARQEGRQRETHLRVAGHEGKIYLALWDEGRRVVEVDAEGWRFVTDPPVRFRVTRNRRPLVTPVPGGSISDLREVLNLADERSWKMLVAFILAALRPQGPYPLAWVSGEQGSAKSFLTEVVCFLLDHQHELGEQGKGGPRCEEDLVITAYNNWVYPLDNLSKIPDWMSDALCRVASGKSFSKRKLYKDDEEHTVSVCRPVIFNGIEKELVERSDLLDRSLMIEAPVITKEKRRGEDVLKQRVREIAPGVLGAFLDAVAAGLKNHPTVQPATLPRMADTARWVEACAPALGWRPGEFLEAYDQMQGEAASLALAGWVVAPALFGYLNIHHHYEGTKSKLLEDLTALKNANQNYNLAGWPQSPKKFGGDLRRYTPNLRRYGVEVEHLEKGNRGYKVRISKRTDTPLSLEDLPTRATEAGDYSI
jgi:hypothetical protein